ncbi:MAG: hypothetical protein H0U12_07170 [Thermoleophilaceae bacterium]|nr:hypothetical protein [Thermoleophilaceae bacterium]
MTQRGAAELAILEELSIEIGATRVELERAVSGSTSHADREQRLERFKLEVKRRYRAVARKLHPDVTGGDAALTERFKLLAQVMEHVEQLQLPSPLVTSPHLRRIFVSITYRGTTSHRWRT